MKNNQLLKILLIPILLYTLSFRGVIADIVVCFCESGNISIELADQCSGKCPDETQRNPDMESCFAFTNAFDVSSKSKCQDIPLLVKIFDQNTIRFASFSPEIKPQKNEISSLWSKPRFSSLCQSLPSVNICFNSSTSASMASVILIV